MPDYLLFTCEHGGHGVPPRYRTLLQGQKSRLKTHAGYDIGALTMAAQLSKSFKAPLVVSTITRLLVDLNRSRDHPRLHAENIKIFPFVLGVLNPSNNIFSHFLFFY